MIIYLDIVDLARIIKSKPKKQKVHIHGKSDHFRQTADIRYLINEFGLRKQLSTGILGYIILNQL
jgi:hypothetical protein